MGQQGSLGSLDSFFFFSEEMFKGESPGRRSLTVCSPLPPGPTPRLVLNGHLTSTPKVNRKMCKQRAQSGTEWGSNTIQL